MVKGGGLGVSVSASAFIPRSDQLRPDVDPWGVPIAAIALIALLFGVVPLTHLATGISLLFLTALALIIYISSVVAVDLPVTGVLAGLLTLATVNAQYPLIYGATSRANLELYLADLFLAVFLTLVGWWRYTGQIDRPYGFLSVVLGAMWVGWAVLAAIFGAGPSTITALFFAIDQARFMLYLFAGLCLALLIPLRTAVVTIAIAGVAHAPVAIAQSFFVGADGLDALGSSNRINTFITMDVLGRTVETGYPVGGFAGNATALATITLLSLAVCLFYLLRGSQIQRRVAAAGIVPVSISIFLSGSDTAIIALFSVAAGTIIVLSWHRLPVRARHIVADARRQVAAAGIGAVVVGAAVVWSAGITQVFAYIPIAEGDNLGPRLQQYQAAIEIAREYPVFGLGGANFELVANEYGSVRANAIHSTVFEFLAGTGIIGLGLYLTIFGVVAWYAIRAVDLPYPHRHLNIDRPIVLLLCVWATGFVLLSLLNLIWPAQTSNSVFWLLAGMVVGLGPE